MTESSMMFRRWPAASRLDPHIVYTLLMHVSLTLTVEVFHNFKS